MKLSKDTVDILIDMIENKLTMIQVSDREDVKEVVMLKHCLSELQSISKKNAESSRYTPVRGRRRKFTKILEEAKLPEDILCLA
jgi:hypothetical protein